MECLLLRVHWLPFDESCAIGALVWFAAHSDRGGSLGQSWSVLSKCTLRFSWIKPKLKLCRSLFISNISFHTPYFSCGKPHALIFLLFIVSIRAKKCCHTSYTPKAFSKVILCQKRVSDLFSAAFLYSFKLTRKMLRINLFMGLRANTFPLAHRSFEKVSKTVVSDGGRSCVGIFLLSSRCSETQFLRQQLFKFCEFGTRGHWFD